MFETFERLPSASICNNKANLTRRAVDVECAEVDGNNGNDEDKGDSTEEVYTF